MEPEDSLPRFQVPTICLAKLCV